MKCHNKMSQFSMGLKIWSNKKKTLVVMLVGLFVILVTRSDFFFAEMSLLGHLFAQPGSPGFFFPSLFLSSFLSFFLVHPYGLGGEISLSPVSPLDYVKQIGKFKMEISPKNLMRIQGWQINGIT